MEEDSLTKNLDRKEHSERLSNGLKLTSHSTLGTKSVRSAVSRALNKSIWLPLCVHEPKVRWHSCTSKGKKATSTEQELLVMDGWSHMTWPSLRITTLVSMVLVNSSSALEIIENGEASLKFPVHIHLSFFCVFFFPFVVQTRLPVIQDNVRAPHVAAGYADGVQTIIVLLLPGEVGIHPHLPYPQVGGQDLVALVLIDGHTHTQTHKQGIV